MAKTIWIDSDCGIDDAVALMAASYSDLNILGASACFGNVREELCFKNIRNILALCDREDIAVYHGSKNPLLNKTSDGSYFHGENGLRGIKLKESSAEIETKKAYDAIRQAAIEAKGELTVVALGPLTNIALALRIYPSLENLIDEIVIMGGSVGKGNAGAYAEFNIYVDPEAAKIVFDSSIPVVMCGLDVTHALAINEEDFKEIEQLNSEFSRLFVSLHKASLDFYEKSIGRKVAIHDLVPIFYLLYPEMFEAKKAGIQVEVSGEARGRTVCDLYSYTHFHNENGIAVINGNYALFKEKLIDLLKIK